VEPLSPRYPIVEICHDALPKMKPHRQRKLPVVLSCKRLQSSRERRCSLHRRGRCRALLDAARGDGRPRP